MAITIYELAEFRLGREPETGADYNEAKLQILGGCGVCGASIAAYNAFPSQSGFWKCGDCIGDDGWDDLEAANFDIFLARPQREEVYEDEDDYWSRDFMMRHADGYE